MQATIISIGNELLNGKTINSNASFIAGRLYNIGIITQRILTVRDDAESIKESLQGALDNSDTVIITGGLGPTHDDITKKVVAEFFNSALVFNQAILDKIQERFRTRGIKMSETNRGQARVPEKARLINNPIGTATGLHFEQPDPANRQLTKQVFVLPGVPREMEVMIDEQIIPFLREKNPAGLIDVHVYRTTGIPESKLYEICRDLLETRRDCEVAFLPKLTGVDMRVAVRQSDSPGAQDYAKFEAALYQIAGKYIYTKGDEELEEVIGAILRERQLTLAAAESCTGGLVQDKITDIAGSSEYFMGGMVTYSNESKMKQLDVRRESLEKYGAVSEAVAKEMAEGIRRVFRADIGIATTGIAGPGGGTPEKPVGIIYLGLASADSLTARKFQLIGDRIMIKARGAQAVLELLRRELLGIDTGTI
jgi:nicotinamide-nucleotide amidase